MAYRPRTPLDAGYREARFSRVRVLDGAAEPRELLHRQRFLDRWKEHLLLVADVIVKPLPQRPLRSLMRGSPAARRGCGFRRRFRFRFRMESGETNIGWARQRSSRPNDLLAITAERKRPQQAALLLLFVPSGRLPKVV
jgi:hypothetical protein